jgi:hypothetical protein
VLGIFTNASKINSLKSPSLEPKMTRYQQLHTTQHFLKIQTVIKRQHLRGKVAQACNPSYSGDGDQEDHSLRPAPGKKKFTRPPSQPTEIWALWHVAVIPAVPEAYIGDSQSRPAWA